MIQHRLLFFHFWLSYKSKVFILIISGIWHVHWWPTVTQPRKVLFLELVPYNYHECQLAGRQRTVGACWLQHTPSSTAVWPWSPRGLSSLREPVEFGKLRNWRSHGGFFSVAGVPKQSSQSQRQCFQECWGISQQGHRSGCQHSVTAVVLRAKTSPRRKYLPNLLLIPGMGQSPLLLLHPGWFYVERISVLYSLRHSEGNNWGWEGR